MISNSQITEISAFVPKKIIQTKDNTNFDARKKMMFESVVGIKQIHVCETSNFDMALKACQPLNTSDVDYIVYVTQTPDVPIPGMSHKIQHALELDCGCIDINSACNGFIQGYMIASMLAQTDAKVLLIFSEWLTKIQDPQSTNSLMFGDAAAAMIVEDSPEVCYFELRSDGSRFESVWQPEDYLLMDGDTVSNFAFTDVLELISKEMESGYTVVLHQSNKFILKTIAKQLNIPMEFVPINIDRYGNTSAVSIPLALVTEKVSGPVFACGYGAGLNYGTATFHFNPKKVYYNEQ